MDLETLVQEFAAEGVGQLLYGEIIRTVRAVIFGYRYPPAYSPTGRWDEDALVGLAHDWATGKLLKRGQLQQFLLTNETVRGFRKGMELSFRHFLIGQKKRTALDNLFQRAGALLESDSRFQLVQETGTKATRYWGLPSWNRREPFQGSDSQLIAAGFLIQEIPVIRYGPDARKLSPVISDRSLVRFIAEVLEEIGAPLSLEQLTFVFRYRFDLLEAGVLSLDAPVAGNLEGRDLNLVDTIGDGTPLDKEMLSQETATAVVQELTPRQRLILREYAQPEATLVRVAEIAGCSKSTVENELRRAMQAIRRNTADAGEAEIVYGLLIDSVISGRELGNGGT